MQQILGVLWLIGCSTVLPIIIIWLVTRKQINETNKRTEIIMSALEKNPDVDVAEWLDKLASENKGKLLKEKLMTKLTWGIICLILGIGTIIYGHLRRLFLISIFNAYISRWRCIARSRYRTPGQLLLRQEVPRQRN